MTPIDFDRLSPELAARIDAVCDAFEKSWKTSKGEEIPEIGTYLEGWEGNDRFLASQELALIDRAWRKRLGMELAAGETESLSGSSVDGSTDRLPKLSAAAISQEGHWPAIPGLEIEKVLGSGGMGIVFLARQKALDRKVAVKLLRDAEFATQSQRDRFQQEARAIARLKHPHLVQVYELGEIGNSLGTGYPYLVLEYVPGGNLSDLLRGSPQKARESAELLKTLAEAIHYAHEQGIVHRDLKPANILMQQASASEGKPENAVLSGSLFPKITDFGLAKFLSSSRPTTTRTLAANTAYMPPEQPSNRLTVTHDVIGTPCYMAPEQGHGNSSQIGPTADVYALGAILYETLTGRPPFLGASPVDTLMLARTTECVPVRQLQPGVPKDLETICHKCLAKEPQRRYASAAALARELERFLNGKPIQARPVGYLESSWRWCRRQPVLASMALAFVLVVLGFNIALTLLYFHARTEKQRADQNLLKAREIVDAYLAGVEKDSRLKNADLLSLRKELLSAALPFYEEFANTWTNDPALAQDQVKASYHLALLFDNLGQTDRALAQANQTLERAQKLVDQNPKEPKNRFLLAQTWTTMALLGNQLHQKEEAKKAYENSIDIFRALIKEYPESLEYREGLATICHNFALHLNQQGNASESERYFKEGLELCQVPQGVSSSRLLRRMEGRMHMGLSIHYTARNEGVKSLEEGRIAVELLQALSRDFPDDLELKTEAIRPVYSRAWDQIHLGYLEEGEKSLRKALGAIDELIAKYPSLPTPKDFRAGFSMLLAEDLARQGRDAEAPPIIRMAIDIRERMVVQYPQSFFYRKELAQNYALLANLASNDGRLKDADAAYRKSIEQDRFLAEQFPKEKLYRLNENGHWRALVSVLSSDKRPADAIVAQKQLVGRGESALKDLPAEKLELGAALGEDLLALGDLQSSQTQWADAIETYKQSQESFDRVLAADADNRRAKSKIASVWIGLAKAFAALDRHTEAVSAYDRAIPLTGPSRPKMRTLKARSLVYLGKPKEAAKEIDEVAKGKNLPNPLWYDLAAATGLAHARAESSAEKELLSTKTIELLERSKSVGHFVEAPRIESFRKDPDFASLQTVRAFRDWVDRLIKDPSPPAKIVNKPAGVSPKTNPQEKSASTQKASEQKK